MSKFDFLKKWVFKYEEVTDWDELYENNQHVLFKLDMKNEMDKYIKMLEEKMNIKYPKELYLFNTEVGGGELYANILQEEKKVDYVILGPASICKIYLGVENEVDEYQEIREDEIEELRKEGRMCFCQLGERAFLRLDIIAEEGSNPVYYLDKKIADSLEEFITKLMDKRDYFYFEL